MLKSKFAQPLRAILSPSDHLRLFNNLEEVPASLLLCFLRLLKIDVANYLWLTYLPAALSSPDPQVGSLSAQLLKEFTEGLAGFDSNGSLSDLSLSPVRLVSFLLFLLLQF